MTATHLIDTRTDSFGDNSTSAIVKPPVNGCFSALPRAKLELILGVTECLMTFRNREYYNQRNWKPRMRRLKFFL